MLVERVEQYLKHKEKVVNTDLLGDMKGAFDFAVTRQLMETREPNPTLRGSNPGPCARKMAYALLDFPQTKDTEPRTMLTWLMGDIVELVAVALVRLSGVVVEQTALDSSGQAEGFFDVGNGLLVPCHADGIVPAQEGVCDKPYLFEVKSTNDFAFKRDWLKGKVDTGYMLQHQVYLDAFGLDRGVFFVVNKNTGHFTEVLTEKNESLVEQARANYTAAGFATPEDLPPRYEDGVGFGRKIDKKGVLTDKLGWACTYCSFLHTCWTDVEVTFESGRPVHTVPMSNDGESALVDKSDLYLDI